ncbi:sensor histidine kinase [Methylobacterium sp. J-076]|uniref:sensor histidine kinase n=1 Tax=Methylobacterium sp. J-076 TaxID=2836655 RepID=UPI001FBB4C32|nr:PAS domain-containing sensor histidine kinase [Methylobacterium sp. J-076]MCJ2013734.1 ATP-binding protein [Methylobacterium sp. J-076]
MRVGRAAQLRVGVGILALFAAGAAFAEMPEVPATHGPREMHGVAGLAVFGGLVAFAVIVALLYLYERARWTRREQDLVAALNILRGAHDRAEMLLNADRQVVITWDEASEPVIEGDVGIALDGDRPAAGSARRVLAFGAWLIAADAHAVEAALETLLTRGSGFSLDLRTQTGRSIEAQGRTVAGRALLRLRETSSERREIADLRITLDETRRGLSALSSLLDAIPQPVWRRNRDGALAWVNAAYVAAVEAGSREATLDAGLELLDRPARETIVREEATLSAGASRRATRVSAVVAGTRHVLDVYEASLDGGKVGIAVDVSELESVRADLQQQMNANARTLDQLPTAVAMFDVGQRLIFHNTAYRALWDLDQAFLDSRPSDGEILDHLRSQRKLEEHADFRAWKHGVLAAYRAAEANQAWWYLPDGRTLRVVADPNPQGGLTYLFEDMSDRLNAESRYNALRRLQAETLDTLAEPVAVFGADGRLQLANRAFTTAWRLEQEMVDARPHVDAVIARCKAFAPAENQWLDIRDAVVGLEARAALARRIEMVDGTVLDCAIQPLPEGATLLTLIDVTASVNVERMLTEKNEALEKAADLRDTFVHHVSYELRSPLTNIIGFTQLLGDETVGDLNTRQREYADHIMRSSGALLVMINDILDLASIDAGSLELQREDVDVQATVDAAVRGLEDRLAEARIALSVDVAEDVGSVRADGKRIRQILFNLLSNAVGFSDPGQRVEIAARRSARDLILSVRDHGCGMTPEVRDLVFNRFESHTRGTRHRGVGLGLSIVRSFVELHGGRVELESEQGIGTCVTCIFPLQAPDEPRHTPMPRTERSRISVA